MSYTSWSVAFAEQPSTAKWNILGTNAADADTRLTTIEAGYDAWTSFTPTWANLTPSTGGNALNTGYYQQIGKTVFYRLKMIFGTSAPSMGSAPRFLAPVAPNTDHYSSSIGLTTDVGQVVLLDAATTEYFGVARVYHSDTTYIDILVAESSSTHLRVGVVTATAPFTWAPGDGLSVSGTYEAA